MTTMTGIEQAVAKAGSLRLFAKSLKPHIVAGKPKQITAQAVHQWVKRGWAPTHRVLEIEEKYGIDRSHLVSPMLVDIVGDPSDED